MLSALAVDRDSLEDVISQVVASAAEKIFQANQGGLAVARAWVYQRPEQVREGEAPYYVGWYDPDGKKRGKSCGLGTDGKRNAAKLRRKIEAELLTGTYGTNSSKTWAEFKAEYESKTLSGKAPKTKRQTLMSLRNFERIIRPGKVSGIKNQTIATFVASRRAEKARYKTGPISPASVNADLRNIKAALAVAAEWGYLKEVPKFHFEREPERLPLFVNAEHFGLIYSVCDQAQLPSGLHYPAPDWWRAFFVMAYMTGWRVGELLDLRREDLDLNTGTAITRWESNKGKRDEAMRLHPIAVEHLRKIVGFGERAFPWPHNFRTLTRIIERLQKKAGVALVGRKKRYSFHDLRRAFGTLNAGKMPPRVLQMIMRHKSLQTTMKFYVNPMAEIDEAVGKLAVPDVLKTG